MATHDKHWNPWTFYIRWWNHANSAGAATKPQDSLTTDSNNVAKGGNPQVWVRKIKRLKAKGLAKAEKNAIIAVRKHQGYFFSIPRPVSKFWRCEVSDFAHILVLSIHVEKSVHLWCRWSNDFQAVIKSAASAAFWQLGKESLTS